MRKISIIGNFDIKNNSYNGQTIKTRIVADELESLYGASEIKCIDTAGGKSVVLRLLFQLFGCVVRSRNVIILPAQNGIKVILPLVVIYNLLFRRRIHYVVIGGWLAELLQRNRWLLPFAKRLHMIYPETQNMKTALAALGLHRVKVMPTASRCIFCLPTNSRAVIYVLCVFVYSRVSHQRKALTMQCKP